MGRGYSLSTGGKIPRCGLRTNPKSLTSSRPSEVEDSSSTSCARRVLAQQAAVESRFVELDGMETINTGLRRTVIRGEGDMSVDTAREPHMIICSLYLRS